MALAKRIVVSTNVEASPLDSTPLKRMRSAATFTLQELPHHILIRVLCGVDHEDLKQLYRVSKTIKEAALIVKQWHFEYTTAKKKKKEKTLALEAPNAALRKFKSKAKWNFGAI